jgi:hypothetical protein
MCKMASFIVTKNDVLWSKKSDSHEEILNENKINDKTSSPDFVRVEISPKDDDYKSDLKTWVFKIDQDYLPDWFSKDEVENAARLELKKWYKSKVLKNKTIKISDFNENKIFIDCVVDILDQSGGYCRFYGSTGTVSNQSCVDCRFYGSTGTVSNQSGGYCLFYGSTGTVSNQSGGDCRFYGSSVKKI